MRILILILMKRDGRGEVYSRGLLDLREVGSNRRINHPSQTTVRLEYRQANSSFSLQSQKMAVQSR